MSFKQEILNTACHNPFNAYHLILVLKQVKGLSTLYSSKVRHYTLEKHTLLVLNEFEKHFKNTKLPISNSFFRIFLAIHDIGKPLAFQSGKLSNQHSFSIKIIKKISTCLPFNSDEIELCKILIMNDPIGFFFQNKITVNVASEIIINSCKNTFLNLKDYFRVLTIYYQVDTGSYTKDAGGMPYLEHIFCYENGNKTYDLEKGLLQFSYNFEQKYTKLEKVLIP